MSWNQVKNIPSNFLISPMTFFLHTTMYLLYNFYYFGFINRFLFPLYLVPPSGLFFLQTFIWHSFLYKWKLSLVAHMVKNMPIVQETRVQFLDRKIPFEKRVTTHSSVLARRILWKEKPGRLQSTGSQRVRHDWGTNTFNTFHINVYHFVNFQKIPLVL